MPINPVKRQASIIQLIREMVQRGESEEAIVKTLKDIGVDSKKAKQLLFLGQADTFAILKGEISKIVASDLEKEKPALVAFLRGETKKAEDEVTKKVEQRALNAFKEDQAFIENQASMFQARINQGVKNIMSLNTQTKKEMGDISTRVSNVERDSWALKHRVFGNRITKAASILLIGLQTGLVVSSAYLFITLYEGLSVESMILAIIIGSIIAAMVYLLALLR